MLLLYTFLTKWSSLKMAVQYGDYLFCTSYDVPFRIITATMPKHPMQSLLLPGVAGARTIDEAPHQELSRDSFVVLSGATKILQVASFTMLSFCTVFSGPPLYLKLLMASAGCEWGLGLMGMLKIVVALATVALPCISLWLFCTGWGCWAAASFNFSRREAAANCIGVLTSGAMALFWLLSLPAAPAVVVTMWEPLLNSPSRAELLHKSWLFAACSGCLWTCVRFLSQNHLAPYHVAAMTLQKTYLCNPAQNLSFVGKVDKMIMEHPEWHLIPLLDDDGCGLSVEKMAEIAAKDPEPDRHFVALETLYLNNKHKYDAMAAQAAESSYTAILDCTEDSTEESAKHSGTLLFPHHTI
mmetsp:Transcript_28847/g.67157  ORF Transcript_28847/g.67157 Transcript_28847/m.67157 type:complete len:355 (-) Transcript_28847:112-1176(-)